MKTYFTVLLFILGLFSASAAFSSVTVTNITWAKVKITTAVGTTHHISAPGCIKLDADDFPIKVNGKTCMKHEKDTLVGYDSAGNPTCSETMRNNLCK